MLCYNDICRAAFHLPPQADNTSLRSLAPDLADELKVCFLPLVHRSRHSHILRAPTEPTNEPTVALPTFL